MRISNIYASIQCSEHTRVNTGSDTFHSCHLFEKFLYFKYAGTTILLENDLENENMKIEPRNILKMTCKVFENAVKFQFQTKKKHKTRSETLMSYLILLIRFPAG